MTVELVDEVVLTPEQCDAFLEIYEADPGIPHVPTLRELGVPGTRGQIKEAVERQLKPQMRGLAQDVVRRALYRRGVTGIVEDVWHNGVVVGQKISYSDRCAVFLGQCTLPEARNQLDVNLAGPDGGPVRVEVEGGRVSTVAGVLALAASLGAEGSRGRLDSGTDRRALPPAAPVLPDPPVDQ